jgi:hypothetical protein
MEKKPLKQEWNSTKGSGLKFFEIRSEYFFLFFFEKSKFASSLATTRFMYFFRKKLF